MGILRGGLEALEHFSQLQQDAVPGAGLYVTAKMQNLVEGLGESFAVLGGGGGGAGLRWRGWQFGVCVAGQLIEANGDGLAEVHGFLHGLRGNMQERVAEAEVVVGEAAFL